MCDTLNNSTSVRLPFLFRLINPVVVAPTIAAVGLSFYSYGVPLVGTCLEIGSMQILLVIIFSLVSLLKLLSISRLLEFNFFSAIIKVYFCLL